MRFIMATLAIAGLLVSNLAFAQKSPEQQDNSMQTPMEHIRSEDQTFLTLPEWFLVYSPEEYAKFIKTKRPSNFPFIEHIGKFWKTYKAVYDATKEKYPLNSGYHVMVMTIGVSTTVEYGLKAAYESTIGRLTEKNGISYRTDEDEYAAKVAQDYVDFIKVDPWYKFDFWSKLKGFWNCPTKGNNQIRKWERRYALSTEYLVKAGYGWIIRKATEASFEKPNPVTATVMRFPGKTNSVEAKGVKYLQDDGKGNYLALLPRYAPYTEAAIELADNGADFESIAGNSDFVMVSVITSNKQENHLEQYGDVLLEQSITGAASRRVYLKARIKSLSTLIKNRLQQAYKVEHIYDF